MADWGGFDPPTGPPAGWYPDPFEPTRERYWDGRDWDLSALGSTAAPTDDYPDLGDWLRQSFADAYRRWRAVLPVAIVASLVPTVLAFIALDRLTEGLVIVDDEVEGWTSDRLPMVITLFAIAVVLTVIGTLALTRLMLDTADGEQPAGTADELTAAGRATLSALGVVPRAFGWGMLIAAGMFVVLAAAAAITVAVPPLGVVLLLAAIPVVAWLGVRWAFLVVSIVDRRGDPFARSNRVSTGRWWPTLGRLVLLGILVWLISIAIQVAVTIVTGGEFSAFGTGTDGQLDGSSEPFVFDDELDLGTPVIIVTAVASAIGTMLTSSVVALAMALLYRTRNLRP